MALAIPSITYFGWLDNTFIYEMVLFSFLKRQYRPVFNSRVTPKKLTTLRFISNTTLREKKSLMNLPKSFLNLLSFGLDNAHVAKRVSSLYKPPVIDGKLSLICASKKSPTKLVICEESEGPTVMSKKLLV